MQPQPETTASARGRNTNAKPLAPSATVTSDGESAKLVTTSSHITYMRNPMEDAATSAIATAPKENDASGLTAESSKENFAHVKDDQNKVPTVQQSTAAQIGAEENDSIDSRTNDDNVLTRSKKSTDGLNEQPAATESEALALVNEPTPQLHTQLETNDTQNNNTQISPTSDTLQVEARAYPWLHMNSTLEACFSDAQKTAKKNPNDFETQLEVDEDRASDGNLRSEAEQIIEFCDELAPDTFSKEAPAIMQSFISHGEHCSKIEEKALQLTMTTPSLESEEPLKVYNEMLSDLDALQDQAMELEKAILRLTSPVTSDTHPEVPAQEQTHHEKDDLDDAKSARAQVIGVFAACLPVLRARMANISMAQELIDSAQENFSLALRMEDMGID